MAGSKFLCTGSGGLQLYLAKDGSVRFDSQPGQVNWYKLHFIINSCKSLLRRPSIRLLLPFLVFICFSYHSFHFSAIWWLQGGGDWKEIVTPLPLRVEQGANTFTINFTLLPRCKTFPFKILQIKSTGTGLTKRHQTQLERHRKRRKEKTFFNKEFFFLNYFLRKPRIYKHCLTIALMAMFQ